MNPFTLEVIKTMAAIVNSQGSTEDQKKLAHETLTGLLTLVRKDTIELTAAGSGLLLNK